MKFLDSFFDSPHKIGRIIEGSPADRCEKVKVDDRILAINEKDIGRLPHAQVINMVRDSGLSIALRVVSTDNGEKEKRVAR